MRILLPSFVSVILFSIVSVRVRAIKLCCPEGEIYSKIGVENTDRCEESLDKYGCVKTDKTLPKSWTSDLTESTFKLSGSTGRFSCPADQVLMSTFSMFPENATSDFSKKSEELVISIDEEKIERFVNFCLYFTDLYEGEDLSKGYFSICASQETQMEKTEKFFTGIFYPAAISISAFFILMTLMNFIIFEDKKKLSSVLTMGFLINAFISYFILSIHYSLTVYDEEALIGTTLCKVLGYIIHHTFIAFFFWTSAMAFNITKTFTKVQLIRSKKPSVSVFLGHICYAQGLPILITVTTALLDQVGPCDITRPNMGAFTCFVQTQYGDVDSFFQSAQFLYFYLIVGLLIIVNMTCFLVTGISLCSHWRNMTTVNSSSTSDGLRSQFLIVLKLFIIMGIPWICDFLSSWAEFDLGFENSFAIRLCLDIINLTTGVLIFIVLVGLQPAVRRLQESSSGLRTRLSVTKSTSIISKTEVARPQLTTRSV